jgi:poly-beta-hydroxyalkanoate depolymerase
MADDDFLDMIRVVFQEQRLARGHRQVGERRVCAQDLTSTALCTVEGDRDDITGRVRRMLLTGYATLFLHRSIIN